MSEITNLEHEVSNPSNKFKLQFDLWFSLVWTIFFILVGIIISYVKTQNFSSFFTTAYAQWFIDLKNLLTSQTINASITSQSLFQGWYYFFITGGLIALAIEIIILPYRILIFKREQSKYANSYPKPLALENTGTFREKQIEENLEKINEWLAEGLRFLSESNIEEAELLYSAIRKEYIPDFDPHGALQKRIISFYEEILAEIKEQENRKK